MKTVYMLLFMPLLMLIMMQMLYRHHSPVSPGIYLVQVLSLSADVVDASPYLVPQALVTVLPKPQDTHVGELYGKHCRIYEFAIPELCSVIASQSVILFGQFDYYFIYVAQHWPLAGKLTKLNCSITEAQVCRHVSKAVM